MTNVPGLIKVASDEWLKLHSAKKDALDDIVERISWGKSTSPKSN